MREIKFRAWDIENKEMHPWDLFDESWLYDTTSRYWVPMQYTGLKDKNDVEIYEGDILEGHDDGLVRVEWFQTGFTCLFDDEGNGIGLDEMCIWFGNNAEVIGNIYENPELLKETNDK